MEPYRVALFVLVVAAGSVVSAVPAGATNTDVGDHPGAGVDAVDVSEGQMDATGEATDVGTGRSDAQNESANDTSLGADISSFMQANAAEVGGEVETGMWAAAFDKSENRSKRERLVNRRTTELRAELADLEKRTEELNAQRESGNLSEVAYEAEASRLIGRIDALRSAINVTTERARQVNTDVEELTTLRTEAKNMTGPEVSSIARNAEGVGVDDERRGRPADAGNESAVENVTDAANETAGPPSDVDQVDETVNASQRNQSNGVVDSPLVGNGSENDTTVGVPGGEQNGTTVDVPNVDTSRTESGPAVEANEFGTDEGIGSVSSTPPLLTSDLTEGVGDALAVRTFGITYPMAVL